VLRVTFTDRDLARVRVAKAADPLWEITNSLHRLQTRSGRWAFAQWHRRTCDELVTSGFGRTVRSMLVPLLPRAAYFPDFLTPWQASDGLEAGLDAILDIPRTRVTREIQQLARMRRAPTWIHRVADGDMRQEVVDALRTYHQRVISPDDTAIRAAVDGDRAMRARAILEGGTEGLLESFRPTMRWRPPVLEVDYPFARDIALTGDGLLLVPSYFCWRYPVALADPDLPPVLIYPLLPGDPVCGGSAATLMGSTRANVLRATTSGMTTGDIARMVGITDQTVSHHLNALRGSRLVTTLRNGSTVLHVRTPLGAAVLDAG
jgi:DNA-binding transcriptional ArsR family regulator